MAEVPVEGRLGGKGRCGVRRWVWDLHLASLLGDFLQSTTAMIHTTLPWLLLPSVMAGDD